jgi:hypothetical protein
LTLQLIRFERPVSSESRIESWFLLYPALFAPQDYSPSSYGLATWSLLEPVLSIPDKL